MKILKKTILDVGIFVAVGIGLVMIVLFFIGRERNLFEPRYTLHARFNDISGLRMGAVVRLAGLNVGYVDGVRFPKEGEGDLLEVVMKVNKDFQDRIRGDSRASIQTQGLLGDKYISISTGTTASAPLQDGAVLQTEGVGGIAALADKSTEMVEEITEAAKSLRKALDNLPLEPADKEHLRKTFANVDQASQDLKVIFSRVRHGEGSLGAFLADPALYHDLRALLGRANRNKLLKNMIRATIQEQDKATRRPIK